MISGSLPRRYARALVRIAQEEDQVEEFGRLLEDLSKAIQKAHQVLETLANESVDHSERINAMKEVGERFGLPRTLRKFLLLLVEKERIGLLPEIVREYCCFQDNLLGIVRVSVGTPDIPSPALLTRIEKVLAKRLKARVIASGAAEPQMLGGIVLRLGHVIYDGSIKRELERIRETLLKG